MEIFGLSGPSGTGKSTVALSFAHKKKIPAIIDDGLLIINGKKAAGTSAKFEKTTVGAVKRAIFFHEDHRNEVKEALKNYFISRVLIIGTSERMIRLIAKNLELGEVKHIYQITDIRSSNEIKIAQFVRKTEGKHVIPIPYKQAEQSFIGRFIQRGKEIFSPARERIGETTIVHPKFQIGSIHIYKSVYKDIVQYVCSKYDEIASCKTAHIHLQNLPAISIDIGIKQPVAFNLKSFAEKLQKELYEQFKESLNIEFFSIRIKIHLSHKKERPQKESTRHLIIVGNEAKK